MTTTRSGRARRVAAFTDDLIRAAVHTGQYSDPAAEKYLADVLIKRRDKITSIYLNAVNPIVAPRLDANSRLTFENAAIAAGVASGPATYRASWFRFDNATGETQALSETQSPTTTIEAPARLADGVRQFRRGGHLRRQRGAPGVAHGRFVPFSAAGARAGRWWDSNGCRKDRQPKSAHDNPSLDLRRHLLGGRQVLFQSGDDQVAGARARSTSADWQTSCTRRPRRSGSRTSPGCSGDPARSVLRRRARRPPDRQPASRDRA